MLALEDSSFRRESCGLSVATGHRGLRRLLKELEEKTTNDGFKLVVEYIRQAMLMVVETRTCGKDGKIAVGVAFGVAVFS